MATTGVDLAGLQQQSTQQSLQSTGALNQYMQQIMGVQQANNAMAAQMASEQRDWSAQQAELTRRYNAAEAAKNRDWQQMMSNTAHQREIKDLIAAGLNPVLSATGGNGASVTSGATASASNPSGASASPDTSANQAIVSLIGNMLGITTRLAEMSTSALTNQAVADKYTSAQMAAAQLSAAASRYGSDRSVDSAAIHAAATRYAAALSSDATRYAAGLSSAATRYAADQSAAASRYASNNARAASNYSVNKHTAASRYGAEQSAAASRYGAEQSYAASQYATDKRTALGWANFGVDVFDALFGSAGGISALLGLLK